MSKSNTKTVKMPESLRQKLVPLYRHLEGANFILESARRATQEVADNYNRPLHAFFDAHEIVNDEHTRVDLDTGVVTFVVPSEDNERGDVDNE